VQDGDGNGTSVVDMGAFESPMVFPPVTTPPIENGCGTAGCTGGMPTTPPDTAPTDTTPSNPPADTSKPQLTVAGPIGLVPFVRTTRTGFAFAKATDMRALRVTVSERSTAKVTLARKVGKFVGMKGAQSLALVKGARHIGWTGKWPRRPRRAGPCATGSRVRTQKCAWPQVSMRRSPTLSMRAASADMSGPSQAPRAAPTIEPATASPE